MSDAGKILKKHSLRSTANRAEILNIFLDRKVALSHADLEEALNVNFDRVTIYRTLKSFEEHGLIHKVLDESGVSKYAVCSEHCSTHHHKDSHVHFNCVKCGNTTCLDEVPIPQIKLPKGYQAKNVNLLVQGICDKCAK